MGEGQKSARRRRGALIAGALLAIAAWVGWTFHGAWQRKVLRGKAVEGYSDLTRLTSLVDTFYKTHGRYPDPAPPSPPLARIGPAPVVDPPEAWAHPTWVELGFRLTEPHYFSFQLERRGEGADAEVTLRARADLDGNHVYSSYERASSLHDGAPIWRPIDYIDELE